MSRKPVYWLGSSLHDLRKFPASARRRAGQYLELVQSAIDPVDFKPMPTVGIGVYELRIRGEETYRVFYVAKFPEAIYVLHAFQKRTRRTARLDIEIGAKRYRELIRRRPGF